MTIVNEIKVDNRFAQGTIEFKKLEAVAKMLEIESPNGFRYLIEDCWEDYGAGFMWTTIVRDEGKGTWGRCQVLSPRQWEDIVYFSTTAADLVRCVRDIRNDKFFRDK